MAHRRRIPAPRQIAFQGSPGSGKTRQLIALIALFARRYHGRSTEFRGQPLPTWAYRLIRNWRNNPHTTGDAPRALPIAVSTPMRVTTTWEREVLGAFPGAEVLMIDTFRDVDAWMARCATSTAPVVVGVFSQSKTRAFSLDWEPAVRTRARSRVVPVKDERRARRAVLVEGRRGPSWAIPDGAPRTFIVEDEERLLGFLRGEGVATGRPWSLSAEGVIRFDDGDAYEVEGGDDPATWALRPLIPVEPLTVDGTLVGFTHAATGQVITETIAESVFFCPDCGALITAPLDRKEKRGDGEEDDTAYTVTSITYFRKQQRECRICRSPLWQRRRNDGARAKWPMPTFAAWSAAVEQLRAEGQLRALGQSPTTSRIARVEPEAGGEGLVITTGREAPSDFSPFEYLYLKYPGCVAHHAADEAHNARGTNTDIARSVHYGWQGAQTRSLLSGTISGGMLDGLYHLLYRFRPALWRRLGLGWADVEEAIRRYGFTQETVTEHQGDARRGSGKSDVSVSTVPAPGMSAKLLPMLMEFMIFIDAERDLGGFMPDLEEIPEVVDMDDPQIRSTVAEAEAAVGEALAAAREAHDTYESVMNDPGATDHERADAAVDLELAEAAVETARANERAFRERARAVDLAGAYRELTGWLEKAAKDRIQPAILAKGILPRWWSVLPCVRPAFKVTRTLRGDWGDVEGQETLYQAPVLAEDYRYPLEQALLRHVEDQLGKGRTVMVYIEQNDVRSTPRRLEEVLAKFGPWTLPNNVAPEDREDAIREAFNHGKQVFIVGYRRVSEGLNLQFLDTIIWYELAMNYYHLRQSNQRIQRLGATSLKQVVYLVYRGSVAHKKLVKLGEQSGSASLFAGDTPEGALVKTAGADRTTLARMSASVEQAGDEPAEEAGAITMSDAALREAFARRSREANAARKKGRTWIGVEDTLPERLNALRAAWASSAAAALPVAVAAPAPSPVPAPVARAATPAPAASTPAPGPAAATLAAPAITPAPAAESRPAFGDLDFIGATLRTRRKRAREERGQATEQLDLFAAARETAGEAGQLGLGL